MEHSRNPWKCLEITRKSWNILEKWSKNFIESSRKVSKFIETYGKLSQNDLEMIINDVYRMQMETKMKNFLEAIDSTLFCQHFVTGNAIY